MKQVFYELWVLINTPASFMAKQIDAVPELIWAAGWMALLVWGSFRMVIGPLTGRLFSWLDRGKCKGEPVNITPVTPQENNGPAIISGEG